EAWDGLLEVNLTAPFLLAQAIGAGMASRGRGKIIFTASLLSFQGGINVAAYTASKHAIAGLTKALANEWAPSGVNVNAVAPGYVLDDADAAPALGDALLAGGLSCVEITFRTSAASDAIGLLAGESRLTVGAGTVLEPDQADLAVGAGAQFIVSPGLDPAVI